MRRLYGAPWYHLVLHAALAGVLIWVVGKVHVIREASNVALWFVGALVLHDLVVLPLYSALDGVLQTATAGWRRDWRVPILNHVRVPAFVSAVLFLGFPGLLLGKSNGNLHYVSGTTPSGYLLRWALISLALFAGSALIWVVRVQQLHDAADPAGDRDLTGW